MRPGISHSFLDGSLFSNLYILFLVLSILPIVQPLPQPTLSSSQSSSYALTVRSGQSSSSSSTRPTSSHNPINGPSATSSTRTSAAKTSSTTTSTHKSHITSTFSPSSTNKPTSPTSPSATSTSSDGSYLTSSQSISRSNPAAVTSTVSQTTPSVPPTDSRAPTTLDASNAIPDVTGDSDAPTSTSVPSENSSNGSTGGGFLHNTGAVAGTFTVVGVVVAGLIMLFVVTRLKRKQGINSSNEDDDYVVNDRSGRTGFTSVNYGKNSVTEMSERNYSVRSYMGNDVEHTLGQEVVQQSPFDPFHRNNLAFTDHAHPSDYDDSPRHVQVPLGTADQRAYYHSDYYNELHASHAVAESDIPFRYEQHQHPYATDAVHITPLRRQTSEHAEYGLAC